MEITRDWSGFSPQAYLREYYADVGSENFALLHFLVWAFHDIPPGGTMLDFGGGPTIYASITASTRLDEIHFCDYLETNLEEVRKWLRRDAAAFDWSEFIQTALKLEDKHDSPESVALRAEEIRQRVTRVLSCDANLPMPIVGINHLYDILVTNFCAESATDDRKQWHQFILNITSLLKPNGRLIMSALKGADSYRVGEKTFPAVNIVENDVIQILLEAGFTPESITIESVPADRPSRHYQGLMLVLATKLGHHAT